MLTTKKSKSLNVFFLFFTYIITICVAVSRVFLSNYQTTAGSCCIVRLQTAYNFVIDENKGYTSLENNEEKSGEVGRISCVNRLLQSKKRFWKELGKRHGKHLSISRVPLSSPPPRVTRGARDSTKILSFRLDIWIRLSFVTSYFPAMYPPDGKIRIVFKVFFFLHSYST